MATITFTIDDAKVPEFKAGFLKFNPVPLDEQGAPIMGDNAWIKEALRRWAFNEYKRGKRVNAEKALVVSIDDAIIG